MSANQTTKVESVGSIVVLGAMNPRIHHPLWYRHAGIITESESQRALEQPGMIITEQVSQFRTSTLRIQCLTERWSADCKKDPYVPTLCAVAKGVFDDKLNDTPLTAVGFNFDFYLQTNKDNVAATIALQLSGLAFGLPNFSSDSGRIQFARSDDSTDVQVDIGASPNDADKLHVHFNYHHKDLRGQMPGEFALEHMQKEFDEAKENAINIAKSFENLEEG